uniref:Transient receptor potential cation channel, subfamily A, member 1b n=1 Tax=Scleropages formosus TaxID=113540 RepID=A0A8C9RWG7_SCLFO
MHYTKEHTKQNNFYKCVIDEEETALASANVFEEALHGNAALLESLSRIQPESLSSRDGAGAGLLHHAALGGNAHVIQFIVNVLGLGELNAQDDQGNTALHWAVKKNQKESCAKLLELGANPNILNNAVMSPLHLAVSLHHNSMLLLSHSCTDVNLEGDLGNTPIILACSVDNCEAISMLFRFGARLCHQNKLGHFATHAAAFAGARRAMEMVLKIGEEIGYSVEVQLNYLDKSNSSPLHLAVHGGNLDVIKFCISKGAKIDLQQCDKSTALHFACTQGAIEEVKLMLAAYSRVEDIINITDGANQTPLHRAMIFDHVQLAELLISKGADINCIDCKGHTPLLLATSCGAWRSVTLLLLNGASLEIKDKLGRNFLHLAILQPKGLKNLPEDILQLEGVRELMSDEDVEGCTPLHYACRLGVADSVKNMLGLQASVCRKSKDKKSALHFAAQYGRLNTCQRLLETMVDSKLLNEGDEKGLTPLHLASRGGHTKVVELLLRRGALFHSDYKGWSCLHHAAAEGFTQTMNILLGASLKLLDKTDEDGNTALHVAAKEGHVSAVMLLMNRGAEILLNKSDASFVHEAVHHGRKEVVMAIIDTDRCTEALQTFKYGSSQRCVVLDMIELLPESFKYLLDKCVTESDDDVNSPEYHLEYNFQWLQAPIKLKKESKADKMLQVQPLVALNAMVHSNQIDLLTHPVCKKYLEMKWNAYGSKAHILNLAIYSLGLLPLSHVIVSMRPTYNFTSDGMSISMVSQSLDKVHCMFLVLAMNLYAVGKELVQLVQQRSSYFRDSSNILDWGAAISSLIFVTSLLMNAQGTWHWQAGAWAVLLSWVNFLLYLQRFEHFGIYVVMFGEILRTLISIIMLFFFLMLAFALAFYTLMLGQRHFERLDLSVVQTFVMMAGELNYQDNFLEPCLNGSLPFPYVTYSILVWFVLLMPILLMNLLIGLAVGDIAEVQKNAALKRIAMQIELHTSLEEKLPYWFMKRVDKERITVYPNKICGSKASLFRILFQSDTKEAHARLSTSSQQLTPLEHEVQKQKYRLKEISSVLEKQHNLLKLIIRKMEITSEADDCDGPQIFQTLPEKQLLAKKSRWIPLVKATTQKQ